MANPAWFANGTMASGGVGALPVLPASIPATGAIGIVVALSNVALTFPDAGWTPENELTDALGIRHRMGWKRLTAADSSTTVTVSAAGGGGCVGQVYVASDCALTGTPYEGYATQLDDSSAGTANSLPAGTSLGANRLAFRIMTVYGVNVASSQPATWTERDDQGIAATAQFALDTKDVPAATTEVTGTRTLSGTWAAVNFILFFTPQIIANRALIATQAVKRAAYW